LSIRRWDPMSELSNIREQMNRMWDFLRPVSFREAGAPRIDLHQTPEAIIATAELPGVASKDDVEIHVTPDTLTIRGELRRTQDVRDEDFIHTERYIGRFSRTLPLPVEVKPEEATASYENGLLEIRLPKSEASRGRQPYRVPIQ